MIQTADPLCPSAVSVPCGSGFKGSAEQRKLWFAEACRRFDREKERGTPLEDWAIQKRMQAKFAEIKATREEIDLAIRSAGAISQAFAAAPPFGGYARPSPEAEPAFDMETGTAFYLGDADDGRGLEPAEARPSYQFARRTVEGELQRQRDDTGILVDPKKKIARDGDAAELLAQSHKIAAALDSQGIAGYRDTSWTTHRVYLHSGYTEELPRFRNLCLIPYMAARNRQRSVQALQWFLDCHPDQCRFLTFTSGPRCQAGEAGARVREQHRQLSLLNSRRFMRAAGAVLVFRSTELGTPETTDKKQRAEAGEIEIDQDGGRWYHPHTHCVLFLKKGFIPRLAWSGLVAPGADGSKVIITPGLLHKIHRFWRHVWHEGGLIHGAKEVCKYVTKPGDMLALARDNPAELAQLSRELHGLHMIQPLGELRHEIGVNRKAGLRLESQQTPDGPVLAWVRSPNKCLSSEAEKTPWKRADDREGLDREPGVFGAIKKNYPPSSKRTTPPSRNEFAPKYASVAMCKKYLTADHYGPRDPGTSRGPYYKILSIGRPRAGPWIVKEPVLTVISNCFNLEQVLRDPIALKLKKETGDEYRAGLVLARAQTLASEIKFNTGTTTVAVSDCHYNFATGPPQLELFEHQKPPRVAVETP